MSARKLTDHDAETIRALHRQGRSTYRLAHEYDVSPTTIKHVIRQECYPTTIRMENPPRLSLARDQSWLTETRRRHEADRELYLAEKAKRADRLNPAMLEAKRAMQREEERAIEARRGGRPKGKPNCAPIIVAKSRRSA